VARSREIELQFPRILGSPGKRNELYSLIAAALSPIGSPLKYFPQEFNSLSEGWLVRVVRPRLLDPLQKGRVTAALHEVEVWATGVEGILLEPFLFLFGS